MAEHGDSSQEQAGLPPGVPRATEAPRAPRLRRPPFWIISIGLIAVLASWIPLTLSGRARSSKGTFQAFLAFGMTNWIAYWFDPARPQSAETVAKTMTDDDINNGRLIVVIGIAPVRPAEFVIFRIAQLTASATSVQL